MNLSVTHAWRKDNFKSVFRNICTEMLINLLFYFTKILCITKQETQSEMGCRLQWRKTKTLRVNDRILKEIMGVYARLTLLHPS